MEFTMDKFKGDELTGGTELAKWITENYNPIADDIYGGIKRIVIPVRDLDDESNEFFTIYEELSWVANDMDDSRDIWVCWTEDAEGYLLDWWITGDDC